MADALHEASREADGEELPSGAEVQDDELLYDDETYASLESTDRTKASYAEPRRRAARSRYPAAAPRESALREGAVLAGKYRVERVLKSSPVVAIVLARHAEVDQQVVLKYLRASACRSPEAVVRFLRGASAALQIRNEHAVRIMDVGRLDSGAPYAAMEYLRGWDLGEVLRMRGALPVPDAIDYLLQACEAVAEAHRIGLMHRNLSTSSLLLTRRADDSALVKVLDFGAGENSVVDPFAIDSTGILDSRAMLESLPYRAPEQIRGTGDVDVRVDVWALGAILYELLAGCPVYRADTAPALLAMIAADQPLPIGTLRNDVPPELEAVIASCLEKDRTLRFPSVATLAEALKPFGSADAQASVERISRVSGRRSLPPPLTPSRAIVRVGTSPRVELPPEPERKNRLVPFALAGAGIAAGGVLGAIVALRMVPGPLAPDPALDSRAFAATPAAVATAPIAPTLQRVASSAASAAVASHQPEPKVSTEIPPRRARTHDDAEPRSERGPQTDGRQAPGKSETQPASRPGEPTNDPFGDVR